ANGLSDSGGAPKAGERYSIHDITVDDINPTLYLGTGVMAQFSTGLGVPVLQDVLVNHITGFGVNEMLNIGNDTSNPKMVSFTFNNSIVNAGLYPVWSTGGTTNCAFSDKPITVFPTCFNPYFFNNNAMIALPKNTPINDWPVSNFFPANAAAVGFTKYNNAN